MFAVIITALVVSSMLVIVIPGIYMDKKFFDRYDMQEEIDKEDL